MPPRAITDLKGMAGHVVDLYRLVRFRFENPHAFTKFRQIDSLRRRTGARTFVETGTYLGVTTGRCARVFDRVYTIELDPQLAARADALFAKQPNVSVVQGDAVDKLGELVARDAIDDCLVYLDGHFSGGITACGDLPEPACVALELLAEHRSKIRAVVIDDFRSFGCEPGFPRKSELLRSAEVCFAEHGYRLAVHLDQLIISAP